MASGLACRPDVSVHQVSVILSSCSTGLTSTITDAINWRCAFVAWTATLRRPDLTSASAITLPVLRAASLSSIDTTASPSKSPANVRLMPPGLAASSAALAADLASCAVFSAALSALLQASGDVLRALLRRCFQLRERLQDLVPPLGQLAPKAALSTSVTNACANARSRWRHDASAAGSMAPAFLAVPCKHPSRRRGKSAVRRRERCSHLGTPPGSPHRGRRAPGVPSRRCDFGALPSLRPATWLA